VYFSGAMLRLDASFDATEVSLGEATHGVAVAATAGSDNELRSAGASNLQPFE
jgi:hypothetical protein